MIRKKTGQKNPDNSVYELAGNNGISFKTDIGLSTAERLKPGIFPLLQLIITILASLSAVYMIVGFFNNTENLANNIEFTYDIPLFFTILLTAFSVFLLNSKPISVKAVGAVYLVANTLFLLNKLDMAVTGAESLIYKYTVNAKFSVPLSLGKANEATLSDSNMFFMTFAFVITMLISLACIYRCNFPLLFLCTFPIFELGAYWGWTTYTWTVAIMLISWMITLSLNMINHTAKKRGGNSIFAVYKRKKAFYLIGDNIKRRFFSTACTFVLKTSAIIIAICILIGSLSGGYRPESFKQLRYNISTAFEEFTTRLTENVSGNGVGNSKKFPGRGKAVGGTNGGQLGMYNKISFTGSTALTVKSDIFANTDNGCSTYLRGYTGETYNNNCWDPAEVSDNINDLFGQYDLTPLDYGYIQSTNGDMEGIYGNIDIETVGANKDLVFAPYFSLYSKSGNSDDETYSGISEKKDRSEKVSLRCSPLFGDSLDDVIAELEDESENWYNDEVLLNEDGTMVIDDGGNLTYTRLSDMNYPLLANYCSELGRNANYIDVPGSDDEGLQKVLNEMIDECGLTKEDSIENIKQIFTEYLIEQGFEYSTEPGITPEGEDFIEYFLTEQKKGYCTYFASAGVMLMRQLGYKARYVEGYVISPDQYGSNEITVTDRCAHAWCEVFIQEIGWVPVEFTLGYENDDNPNLTDKERGIESELQSKTDSTLSSLSIRDSSLSSSSNNSILSSDSTASNPATDSNNSGATGHGGNIGTSEDSGGKTRTGKALDKTKVGYISVSLLFIIAVTAAILVRRKLSLTRLEARLNSSNNSKTVISCYEAYIRYLALIGIKVEDNVTDSQMKFQIGTDLAKDFPELQKPFEKLCELAIAAYMGGKVMTDEEADNARQAVYEAKALIYDKLNAIEKILAVWVYNLY